MRFINADWIFPISSQPVKDGLILMDESGMILDISEIKTFRHPDFKPGKLEKYKGIICPGFVNTHCHLELSWMKGLLSEKTGMAGFVRNLVSFRKNYSREKADLAIKKAEEEMISNGIVAVGDISNDDSSFQQKSKGNLKYHTFLEIFDLNPEKAEAVFKAALSLSNSFTPSFFHSFTPSFSITPHSPYTVSPALFELIRNHAYQTRSIVSIHNQESPAESELFINKSGDLFELFTAMGINLDHIPKTGLSSFQSVLPYFSKQNKTVFVHNTCTGKEDIELAKKHFEKQALSLFFCFCPNANLYIENKLPDFQLFLDAGVNCAVGTDSLASNHTLSILDELKVISGKVPAIPLQTLLTWATLNGAKLLGFEQELGSIEKGKKPGLNLISGADLEMLRLTSHSEVRKLA